jgi:hypothetical protein
MMADPLWLDHCAEMSSGLLELRHLLGDNNEAKLLFDEYFNANELELALQVVCEFLLGKTSSLVESEDLKLIRTLHQSMNIAGDCCSQLQQRIES